MEKRITGKRTVERPFGSPTTRSDVWEAWAICANVTDAKPSNRRLAQVASWRYLPERDPQDPDALASVIKLMIDAATQLITKPLLHVECQVTTKALYVWHVREDGRFLRTRVEDAHPTPLNDLANLIDDAGPLFPFRRCLRCDRIFVRRGRQEYCASTCTNEAELARRRTDPRFKERQRKAMREYRERMR